MNSKKIWEDLEFETIKEIQVKICASVVYLVKKRGLRLKDIIKDIKKISKKVGA